jgi:hypothetical protein
MQSSFKTSIFSIILFCGLSHQPAYGMKEFIQEHPLATTVGLNAALDYIIIGCYFAFSYYMDPKAPWYFHFPLAYPIGNQLTDFSQFINSRMLFTQLHNSELTKKQQIQWCKKQLADITQQ